MTTKIDPFKISKELIVDKLITVNQLTVPVYTSLPINSTFAGQLAALKTATGADLYYFDGDFWIQVVDSAWTGGLPRVLAIDNTNGGQNIVMQSPGKIMTTGTEALVLESVSLNLVSPTVNGSVHITSNSATMPSLSVFPIGTSASLTLGSNDIRGRLTITPPTDPGTFTWVEVFFHTQYANAPFISVTPMDSASNQWLASATWLVMTFPGSFKIHFTNPGDLTGVFDYHILG